ncbi:hypothetical protein TRVL_00824 [Trypanosoma vivax]|nr:hypothetical protein TRVL_00824 [Trypanosoma vivax]
MQSAIGGHLRFPLFRACVAGLPALECRRLSTCAPFRAAKIGSLSTKDHGTAEASEVERRAIESEICSLREKVLKNGSDVFHFLSSSSSHRSMVMVLGNHSAGKSTMINFLLGREVQRSGISPTDDGFTVLQLGDDDVNLDGPTAVSDPRFELQELQRFGAHFVSKLKVKTRKASALTLVPPGLTLVDTPGMIDTPIHVSDRTSLEGQLRGYDLFAVTRWFAARCDLILLMFDPANPGTTGETLDVLTKSLTGVEHKFLILLNKADMFDRAIDFARVYGVLCWNLSKVLSLKDLPHIYTTYFLSGVDAALPLNKSGSVDANDGGTEKAREARSNTMVARNEFLKLRNEVIDEVLAAPMRRLDNLITEIEEGAKCMLLAGRVCNEIVWQYSKWKAVSILVSLMLVSVAIFLIVTGESTRLTLFVALLAVVASASVVYRSWVCARHFESTLSEGCDAIVDRLFVGHERTLDVSLRWKNTVKPEMLGVVRASADAGRGAVASLPSLSGRRERRIESLLHKDIPELRLRVAEHKEKYFYASGKSRIPVALDEHCK